MKHKIPYTLAVVLVIGLLTIPLGRTLDGKAQEEKPRLGGTLRLKPFTDLLNLNLDPARDADVFLLEQLYDGLVRLDKSLNVAPGLAEYWSISPDGKTSTFYLRRGVRFHHGRELTSEDVRYSLERLLNRKVASPHGLVFLSRVAGAREFWEGRASRVEGFKAVDRYIFEIRWTNPYVSSLYLLCMFYCKVLPHELLQAQGQEFFWKPMGTGPFKFSYWLRSNRLEVVGVRLEKNSRYFAGPPYLDALEYSPHYTLDHFRDREIDIIPFLSEALADSKCQIQKEGSLDSVFLGMSCHLPPFDIPAVRQALSLVVDRSRIARVATTSDSVPQLIDSFIPAKLHGFTPAENPWRNNLEEARQKLRREGYPEEKPLPALTLFVRLPRRDSCARVYREIQAQLEDLGFRLSLRYFRDNNEILAHRKPYLVLIEWHMELPDAENILRPLFHSQSAWNLTRYSSARFDQWLDEAEMQRSWSKRIDLLRRAEQQLFQDVPAVPLFSPMRRMAIQPRIRGVEVPPLGFAYLDTTKIWIGKGG